MNINARVTLYCTYFILKMSSLTFFLILQFMIHKAVHFYFKLQLKFFGNADRRWFSLRTNVNSLSCS